MKVTAITSNHPYLKTVVSYSSQEALVTGSVEAMVSQESGSRRSLNKSPSQDTFWVPHNLKRQSSMCQSDASSNGKVEFVYSIQMIVGTDGRRFKS